MNKLLNSAAVLLALTFVAGCSPDNKKDKKVEGGSQASGFSLKAELCGTYPSIGDFAEKSGNRRQLSLQVAMGICGKMDGADDKQWHALGMTLSSPDGYALKAGSGYVATDSNKFQFFIEDESKVVAVSGAKSVQIGTVDAVKKAAKIKLANGMTIELVVGNRPYQIGDAKSLPDSEKKLFFSEQ